MDVHSVRDSLPLTRDCIYMNTGHACSPPLRVLRSIAKTLEQEASAGAASAKGLAMAKEVDARARNVVAGLIGADLEDVQITHGTREGISIVLYGMQWRAGDELMICDLEHAALLMPAEVLARRCGLKVVRPRFDSRTAAPDILRSVELSLNSNTRLIALSHIQYGGGLRMPVRDIARAAHARGIPFIVDGAQSVGQIAVDVKNLGCDFYALSGQKWLMGPAGTGALYVRPESRDLLEPMFTTHEMEERRRSRHPPLSRFALTSQNSGLVAGLAEAVRLNGEIGIEQIESRSKFLAAFLRERLEPLPVEIISSTLPSSSSGVVTIRAEGWSTGELVAGLQRRFNIVARAVTVPAGVRFCAAYFNTEDEVEQVARALKTLMGEGHSTDG
jgi:L-cysteine/cystine lyase